MHLCVNINCPTCSEVGNLDSSIYEDKAVYVCKFSGKNTLFCANVCMVAMFFRVNPNLSQYILCMHIIKHNYYIIYILYIIYIVLYVHIMHVFFLYGLCSYSACSMYYMIQDVR